MKLRLTVFIAMLLFLTTSVYAELHDRGNGLIYDDVLNVTWLQDANYAMTSGYDDDGRMTWEEAVEWTKQLNYNGYTGWRLPYTMPVNGSTYNYTHLNDGSSDDGYNISAPGTVYAGSTGSEMAYMFLYELGNLGYCDASGNCPQEGWGLTKTGPFTNIMDGNYWSGTEYGGDVPGLPSGYNAWCFHSDNGAQGYLGKASPLYAWAVRDGDVIPQPLLLGWDYPNGLITVNPVTAGYVTIFDSNRQFEAMAYDPNDELLYAIENLGGDNLLVSIDYKNEIITDIGYIGGYTEITSMTYDRTSSTLFAIDQATRTLLEIDPQTGAGTPITNYTLGTSNALAAHPLTGELYLGWGVDPSHLKIIDKSTGELTDIGSMVIINSVTALEFHPVTFELYGAGGLYNGGGQLFTVNLTTGAVNPIGPLRQVLSLAFIDQPIEDTDGDGIPDNVDACPSSDLSGTVIIDGWDTGVDNVLLVDGCTISDLIAECVEGADNHGEFVSSVSHTTNTLKEEGIISGKDKGMIQKGAVKAAIP